jgi:hypothetical protein
MNFHQLLELRGRPKHFFLCCRNNDLKNKCTGFSVTRKRPPTDAHSYEDTNTRPKRGWKPAGSALKSFIVKYLSLKQLRGNAILKAIRKAVLA